MDKLDVLLRDLAVKVGTTTEHLWGVLLKQAYIDAWVCLIVAVVIVVLHSGLIAGGVLDLRAKHWNVGHSPVFVPSLILLILTLPIVSILLLEVFTGFYNPEYFALRLIIRG